MTGLRFLFDEEFDKAYQVNATPYDMISLILSGNKLVGSYSKTDDDIIIRVSQGLENILNTIDHEFVHGVLHLMGEDSAMYDNISDVKWLP